MQLYPPPHPPGEQTDACENITSKQLRLRAVKLHFNSFNWFDDFSQVYYGQVHFHMDDIILKFLSQIAPNLSEYTAIVP